MISSSRDNWERLMAAVVKKQQLWEMFHSHSNSSFSSDLSSMTDETVSHHTASVDVTTSLSTSSEANTTTGLFIRKLISWLYPRKHHNALETVDEDYPKFHGQFIRFSRHQLQVATDNFSIDNVLAGPGWRTVYKGKLEDGSFVAVVRMREGACGNTKHNIELRFKTEIQRKSVVAHPNLVNLLGFCITVEERLLVYPHAVNGNVASYLKDGRYSQVPLRWIIRKKIALGTAKGLSYLHEECEPSIIHRDVRAANIFLNDEFEPFISDHQRDIVHVSINQIGAYVSTAGRGTLGHIAPEYLFEGRFSDKTDVYGYGVFLLELLSGLQAFDLAQAVIDESMAVVDWVWRIVDEGRFEEIVKQNMFNVRDDDGTEVVKLLLQMCLICTNQYPDERPKMSQVVRMLEDGNCLAQRWEHYQRTRKNQINQLQVHFVIYASYEILAEEVYGTR